MYEIIFFTGENERELASVRVLEPERSFLSISARKPEYIKRKPLAVPNREKLLRRSE